MYEGNRVIEGAEQVIAAARKRGLILRFVTNTATKSSSRILDNLKSMGMDVNPEELYTAPMAARDYLQQQGLRPYCLIHEAIRAEFEQLEQTEPDSVLLGDARDDLSYQNLNRAFALCKNGAPLIGIGMNKYFQDEDGLKLDAGAFIHAIEWAADVDAIIMGKPSAPFFEQVVASTGVPAADCLM
ncbi:MAG: TIGR01458 family HAD-type hydrolase, partial [Gammaproteobacteria bacterium]|nr:TIGR01458 family HAD-type hydrolase [Gammaproteobacteria bacterium]